MDTSLLDKISQLNRIGMALSAQTDIAALLSEILTSAQQLTGADGGTFYRVINGSQLSFDVVQNTSLNIAMGGSHPTPVPFPAIPLKLSDGKENLSAIASYVANKGETVNIEDIYFADEFDFSGALKFDQTVNYRTKSMLTVPLKNADQEVIGVLQLINSTDENGDSIAFSSESESLAKSLASQASVALINRQLIEEHKQLFESFTKLVADAIDKKSPYTGKHCQRVPVITMMLAEAANKTNHGPFKNFYMNDSEQFELETAAWLHDCGKLTTPDYIMDKSTKLETKYDRIELIRTRLNLKAHQNLLLMEDTSPEALSYQRQAYQAIFKQLARINSMEFLTEEDKLFLENLSKETYVSLEGEVLPLISEDEFINLTIPKGTLTDVEREKMQDHAAMSISMLSVLPFPKELKNVPEYAGGHHERMDGKGYPNQLTKEQLSIPARMMGIADIFEALSAGDRPYKKAKKLSESLKILGFLKLEGHIDPDLFDLFVEQEVYMDYAKKYLHPEQIDEVIKSNIPGYEGQ
ncbi:HD family phosphohydrolase [Hydrogenovibrio sp. JE_KL2]|uniref:GAF and HD-GYP domain-containing protein n=1 Tax=Hydrogenovibrio sp. JE_KL2 TaxID=2651188 RepID=UPI00128E92A1|nr:HD family phosphohydrolase [Hydrogenovibrio sp. JE_KL2]MPQ77208.1 GAF domain-containing protein [Hydrogenovibrio sp. JE_KL2]